MKLSSAILTLFLVMDPLGNIPPFLSVLKNVQPDRRRRVLIREILIAYVVLLVFLFLGRRVLALLSLQQETISVAGGIVLFLIALRMIFPTEKGLFGDTLEGEPFIVPLAIVGTDEMLPIEYRLPVASVFTEPELWQPALSPVLTRLSLNQRRLASASLRVTFVKRMT